MVGICNLTMINLSIRSTHMCTGPGCKVQMLKQLTLSFHSVSVFQVHIFVGNNCYFKFRIWLQIRILSWRIIHNNYQLIIFKFGFCYREFRIINCHARISLTRVPVYLLLVKWYGFVCRILLNPSLCVLRLGKHLWDIITFVNYICGHQIKGQFNRI